MSDGVGLICLVAGVSRCMISPGLGGSIFSLDLDGFEILRAADPGAANILGTGAFPLLPFCNRLPAGSTWSGRRLWLAADPEGAPHALHGHGWRRGWEVVRVGATEAELEFEHLADEWPWSYRASQTFRLSDGGLELEIAITNLSDGPMPCGCGIHPYFRLEQESYIETDAQRCLVPDARGIASLPRDWSPGRRQIADLPPSDTLLLGPETRMTIGNGRWRVAMEASDVAGWHLYRPVSGAFFCVEPVSHWPAEQPRLLATAGSGGDSEGRWRFAIRLVPHGAAVHD